jgi:hypothetical protein
VRVSSGYLSATWVTIRGAVTPMRIRVAMLADTLEVSIMVIAFKCSRLVRIGIEFSAPGKEAIRGGLGRAQRRQAVIGEFPCHDQMRGSRHSCRRAAASPSTAALDRFAGACRCHRPHRFLLLGGFRQK